MYSTERYTYSVQDCTVLSTVLYVIFPVNCNLLQYLVFNNKIKLQIMGFYSNTQSLFMLSLVIYSLHCCLVNSFTSKFDKYNINIATQLSMSSKYLGKEPVFVAGGSSGVGYEVIKKLSALGTPVKVLIRRESAREYLEKLPGVTVEMGDALDEASVQKCMTGCVAAITTLGQYVTSDAAVEQIVT